MIVLFLYSNFLLHACACCLIHTQAILAGAILAGARRHKDMVCHWKRARAASGRSGGGAWHGGGRGHGGWDGRATTTRGESDERKGDGQRKRRDKAMVVAGGRGGKQCQRTGKRHGQKTSTNCMTAAAALSEREPQRTGNCGPRHVSRAPGDVSRETETQVPFQLTCRLIEEA